MLAEFAYGRGTVQFNVPHKQLLGILKPEEPKIKVDGKKLVKDALHNPINSLSLAAIIKKKAARNAVIIVNDITRPTPYRQILPPLLAEIEGAGIKPDNIILIVATGIHRPQTQEENYSVFGADICRRYRIENHNCDRNLVSLGRLSSSMDLRINRTVAEADLLVTTGLVGLHYFAGYSGGRKSILPGVAARELIEANHKMMNDHRACLGNYHNNPVNEVMLEAACKTGVDFILNVVTGTTHEIEFAAAGDLYYAWLEAVKFCEMKSVLSIKQRADIVIAGCGGYPKDINMYQAQKALDAASLAVKVGGTIILVAECPEGMGEATFEEWIIKADSPQDIEERFFSKFELGGHKAYAICRLLKQTDIMLVSSLPESTVRKMYLKPFNQVETALKAALNKCGNQQGTILLMPEAPKIAVRTID